ncbi:MAG: hypothetical protein DDT40_01740 [candidate division WS2 bacterium]|nr:hypothetical protein [Candidatus Psychracetigena formicireducens]
MEYVIIKTGTMKRLISKIKKNNSLTLKISKQKTADRNKRWRQNHKSQWKKILDTYRHAHLKQHSFYQRKRRHVQNLKNGVAKLYTNDYYVIAINPKISKSNAIENGIEYCDSFRNPKQIKLLQKLRNPIISKKMKLHIIQKHIITCSKNKNT